MPKDGLTRTGRAVACRQPISMHATWVVIPGAQSRSSPTWPTPTEPLRIIDRHGPRGRGLSRHANAYTAYTMVLPNLFDFGKPFGGSRPASARLPRQSASSLLVALNSRLAESRQVRPSLATKVTMSERPPSLYFCSRTPRPRAISGTWSSGKISILRLSPITAMVSPSTVVTARASLGIVTFSTCLPLRVLPTQSSSLTMKPCPSWLATRNLRPPVFTNSETIEASCSMSMNMRIGSPWPRPPGSFAASRV